MRFFETLNRGNLVFYIFLYHCNFDVSEETTWLLPKEKERNKKNKNGYHWPVSVKGLQ